jgi:Potato inhibitor I family
MQTSFCCSASTFASIMLLVMGLMVASNNLQHQGMQMSTKEIVQMPKISLPSKQGPWPKCIGMTVGDCISYIQEYTQDFTFELIPDGAMVTLDFRADRVRVFVDSNDVVVKAPGRG